MKFNKNWMEKRWVSYAIAACIAVLFYVIITHLDVIAGGITGFFRFVSPVIYGLLMAYMIDALVRFLRRKAFAKIQSDRIARNLSIVLAVLIILTVVVLLFAGLIPQLINSVTSLANNFEDYVTSFHGWLTSLGERQRASGRIDVTGLTDIGDMVTGRISEFVPRLINRIINTSFTIGTRFVTALISFILAIYFLADKQRLLGGARRLLHFVVPEKHYAATTSFLGRCNEILIRYIIYDLFDGLLVGVINLIFMRIAGLPYSFLISVIVGVTNLAPTFGPILGGVIGGLILVLIRPWYMVVFVIFTVILQTVDGYIIKPKLFGGTLGVSPVWILIFIILGARAFGVIGIMIAIPLAAIVDFTLREYVVPWMREQKAKKQASQDASQDA